MTTTTIKTNILTISPTDKNYTKFREGLVEKSFSRTKRQVILRLVALRCCTLKLADIQKAHAASQNGTFD